MNAEGLLEAKVAVVKLKHGIVRRWLIKQDAPFSKFEELDQLEQKALRELHQEARAYDDIIECLSAHETQLIESCHTETGYADN